MYEPIKEPFVSTPEEEIAFCSSNVAKYILFLILVSIAILLINKK